MQYLLFFLFIVNSVIASSLEHKPFWQDLIKDRDYEINIGTGIFIDSQTILSSAHVVNNCSYVAVENSNIPPQMVKLSYSNNELDIAFLVVLSQNSNAKQLYSAETQKLPYVNDTIYVSSFTDIESNDYMFIKATLIAVDDSSIYFSGAFKAGNSGSPIFDQGMNLIGILTAKIETFDSQKKLLITTNQATHINTIKKLVKNRNITIEAQKNKLTSGVIQDYLKTNLVKIYCIK